MGWDGGNLPDDVETAAQHDDQRHHRDHEGARLGKEEERALILQPAWWGGVGWGWGGQLYFLGWLWGSSYWCRRMRGGVVHDGGKARAGGVSCQGRGIRVEQGGGRRHLVLGAGEGGESGLLLCVQLLARAVWVK